MANEDHQQEIKFSENIYFTFLLSANKKLLCNEYLIV